MAAMVAAVLLLLVAGPAVAAKSTYTRRFVNRTSVAVTLYRAESGAWVYVRTLWPGIPHDDREVPKRTDGGWTMWAMDIGGDGKALDLARRDFGTADFRWSVGESIPK